MSRITLVVSSLTSGGAERVAANVASVLHHAGHIVTVVTRHPASADDYILPEAIARRVVSRVPPARGIVRRLLHARRRSDLLHKTIAATDPQLVVTFTTDLNIRVLLRLRAVPVVITEHTNPNLARAKLKLRVFRRVLYPRAQALICVSKGVASFFSWMPEGRVRVIYNSLPPDAYRVSTPAERDTVDVPLRDGMRYVLSCGRLAYPKAFDVLIEAFAQAMSAISSSSDIDSNAWRLGILGSGPDEEKLRALAQRSGIADQVDFLGRSSFPLSVMRRSEIFVLSSRYEGFGNVLIEAMSQGVPVIATDCDYGPAEIVEPGESGILVSPDSPQQLAEAIVRLTNDDNLRKELAKGARARSERFSHERIGQEWLNLVQGIVA
ncbi:MAG: glycosyltransferase family 4 protein [Spirochaetota bacterium]